MIYDSNVILLSYIATEVNIRTVDKTKHTKGIDSCCKIQA